MRPLLLASLAAGLLAAALPVHAQPRTPEPVSIARGSETVAIVESVDQSTRQVLLRREDGSFATLRVGREVRNLGEVKAGDRVVLRHVEAVAVALAPPGTRAPGRSEGAAAIRAAQGERPGLAAAEVIRRRVTITALDQGSGTISFREGTEPPQTVVLRRPEMLEFARGLKVGDQVNLAYAEAVLIAVRPAP
jgi:hypothetical protein